MKTQIDDYFKEISKGDYDKLESLFLNDYEEIRNLYFLLKDYSQYIDTISYEYDIIDAKNIIIISIYTSSAEEVKDLIVDNIPELSDIDVRDNKLTIKMEEY